MASAFVIYPSVNAICNGFCVWTFGDISYGMLGVKGVTPSLFFTLLDDLLLRP